MKPARLAVLGIALAAGSGAAFLMSGGDPPPPPAPMKAEAPPVPTTDVLVAATDMPMGQVLRAADLRWQPWPGNAVNAGFVTRKSNPKGLEETVGASARSGFLAGEPIRAQKLVRPESGFMAAILPPGQRAVAITTDSRGTNSAGGFILPNDRVDVIRTFHKIRKSDNRDVQLSETILTDIRVLAIGQLIQEKNGTNVVTGETATLAVTPAQAEILTLAGKDGALSLSLRSLADAGQPTETGPLSDSLQAQTDPGLTVVRFGVARQQTP